VTDAKRTGDADTRQRTGLDVLIIGAGPTGLTLAAQLQAFGIRFRIVDRLLDRAHESRALAVQARSLEVLQGLGLAEALVRRGRTTTRIMMHFGGPHVAEAQLGDIGAADTAFPFILFVSQAETEAVLGAHLAAAGTEVARGVELTRFHADDEGVQCELRHLDGRTEQVRARYLVGCDGAHSTVRTLAGFRFEGGDYLEDFVLGDVDVDGALERDTLHAFAGRRGFAMVFPLGTPRPWRIIAMSPNGAGTPRDAPMTSALSLEELQAIVDGATDATLALRDPAWLTHFRLHHRQTARYRAGPVFLAGDAAHIHSPVGAQGMNTGIQDAWNLGWKLALVTRGWADPRLLDSYEAERWPVGRALLRTTDRVFTVFTRLMASGAFAAWLRRTIGARLVPWILGAGRIRSSAFRFVSELAIHYRKSPAVAEGIPRLRRGPRAGDRLPDADVLRDGAPTTLQRALAEPRLSLLLCGAPRAWDAARLRTLGAWSRDVLAIHHLSREPAPGALQDVRGDAFARLGVDARAQYLVRPDGYIAFRCAGEDLDELTRYLARWFPRPASATTA
jgi:2-polyprenyl-6-methoxyphenol hydroxylase-like FAD-dependent oxidoreductase